MAVLAVAEISSEPLSMVSRDTSKVLVDEDVPLSHLPDGREGVLDDTHDGLVALRGDDLPGSDVNVLHWTGRWSHPCSRDHCGRGLNLEK